MSHQSDWIYYKQPIKFLVVKVNGMCMRSFDPDRVQNGHIYSSIKEEEVFIYGFTLTFSVGSAEDFS